MCSQKSDGSHFAWNANVLAMVDKLEVNAVAPRSGAFTQPGPYIRVLRIYWTIG